MLDDLLKMRIIKLLESKWLKEARRTGYPKYCKYQRVISYPLEKCIVLKECIMRLARDRKIILNLDDTVEASHISAQLECFSSPWK